MKAFWKRWNSDKVLYLLFVMVLIVELVVLAQITRDRGEVTLTAPDARATAPAALLTGIPDD